MATLHEKHKHLSFTIVVHETSMATWISWAEIPDQATGKRLVHDIGVNGFHQDFIHEEEAIERARAAAHRAIDKDLEATTH